MKEGNRKKRRYGLPAVVAGVLAAAALAYAFVGAWNEWPPFRQEYVFSRETFVHDYAMWLGKQELDDDLKEALLEQELHDYVEPVFTFRDRETVVVCKEKDEIDSEDPTTAYLWLKAEGVNPRLICFNLFNWKASDTPLSFGRGVKYVVDGVTYYGESNDQENGRDHRGLCRFNVREVPFFGDSFPLELDRNEDGSYVTEDGYYRITVIHRRGYGMVGISPEMIMLTGYSDDGTWYNVGPLWHDGIDLDWRMAVVIFTEPETAEEETA